MPSVVADFNPRTLEAEADEPLWVLGQPSLQSKFCTKQGYTMRPCLKINRLTNELVCIHVSVEIRSHSAQTSLELVM